MKNTYQTFLSLCFALLLFTGIGQAQDLIFSESHELYDNKNCIAIVSDQFEDITAPDIAILVRDNYLGDHIAVFFNWAFEIYDPAPDSMYMVGTNPFDLASGDFNNDGYVDLVTSLGEDSSLLILFGSIDEIFTNQTIIHAPVKCKNIALGDFNNDDNLDIAVVTNYHLVTFFGKGDGSFEEAVQYGSSTNPWDLKIADMNGDDYLDILVSHGGGAFFYIHYNDGAGDFSDRVVVNTPRPPWYLEVGYLNADEYPDIFAASGSYGTENAFILTANSEGAFTHSETASPCGYIRTAAIGDLNNNFKIDFVVADNNGLYVLMGSGDGTFTKIDTIDYDLGYYNPTQILIADLNLDDKLDIIVSTDNSTLFYQNDGSVSGLTDFTKVDRSRKLYPNYPNPFYPFTTICYDVMESNSVSLNIYNVMGQFVTTTTEEWKNKGHYCETFNAIGLQPGLYLYQLRVGDELETKKMIVSQ